MPCFDRDGAKPLWRACPADLKGAAATGGRCCLADGVHHDPEGDPDQRLTIDGQIGGKRPQSLNYPASKPGRSGEEARMLRTRFAAWPNRAIETDS